jgi:hypothetical protein
VCAFNFHARDSNLRTTCLRLSLSSHISIFSTHCAEFQLRAHTICTVRWDPSEEPRGERLCIVCVCARPLFCIIARVCALHERYCTVYIKICVFSKSCLHKCLGSIRALQINKKLLRRTHNGEGGVQKQRRMVPTACF